MDAAYIIERLGLEPLPEEGGFYRETYRSGRIISRTALPEGYTGDRSVGTAIYYLVTPDSFSALHRLPGDEVFHFHLGDPAIMLRLFPDGKAEEIVLGNDLARGQHLQAVVPAGVWQGIRLAEDGDFALFGTTMAPGFDFADYEPGDCRILQREYPMHRELVEKFTRR